MSKTLGSLRPGILLVSDSSVWIGLSFPLLPVTVTMIVLCTLICVMALPVAIGASQSASHLYVRYDDLQNSFPLMDIQYL